MTVIRKAEPGEFPVLVDVWESAVRATHDFLTEDDIAFFRNGLLHEWLPQATPHCAISDDGRIQGFVAVVDGNIEMLFIHADSRGNGIGRALLDFAVRSLCATKVDVNEQNPQAVGFYQHMGFALIRRSETDGFGKPYPLLHMALQ